MTATVESQSLNYRNRIAAVITRRELIESRNKSIQSRFNDLYNNERLRYDDVISKLREEFFLSKRTIENVMKG